MFAMGAHHDEPVRSDRRSERLMPQGGLGDADVGERWVAEDDVERTARASVEVTDHVRRDDVGPLVEPGSREIATKRFDRLGGAFDEGRPSGTARQRLDPKGSRACEEIEDVRTFELAARDLEIRGAGEFLGERQSGAPELRVVDLADVDPRLVEETAGEADRILRIDPELGRSEHELLARAVEQLWRRYALA